MFKLLFKLEFGWGTLSKEALQKYVAAKTITAADYQEITGEEYLNPNQNTTASENDSQTTSPTTN